MRPSPDASRYIVFTPDHRSMLVAAAAGDLFSNRDKVVLRTGSHKGPVGLAGASGMLISVSADGRVAPAPYLEGDYGNPEFAPRGFGKFEGELFFTRSTGRGGFVDWINPHTFIYIDVKDAKGVVSTWKWESLPVAMMRKAKITKGMLVGHSVTALGWASRDGTKHSAFLGALTFADGRKIQIADDMYIKEQG